METIKPYLDTVLITFSEKEHWTIRDAVRGVQIFGSIGSGKTSGSGEFIAKKYLKAGFGGLILCAKPDEAKDWQKYAKDAGLHEDDVIVFGEGSPYRFNPLQYEIKRPGKGAGLTYNLTELFMSVFKMGQKLSGSDSQEQDKFWENALKRCINRIIDLLKLAGEEVSVYNMVAVLSSSPRDGEMIETIDKLSAVELEELCAKNFFMKCISAAFDNADTPQKNRDYDLVFTYFLRDFAMLDERTQSNIRETFLGYAEPFLSGILDDHFAKDTNITPEDSFDGKLIILDFSVKNYLVSGIYAQCLFKHLWQQAVERREVTKNTKPVFLWIDESQYFINEYDTIFQTTARSSLACTVLLTQNINNYYAQMGGKSAEAKVNSLLGNLATKIFHTNSDTDTNLYASRMIGDEIRYLEQLNVSGQLYSTNIQTSETRAGSYLPQVQPKEFTTLRSGGEGENDYQVDAIIFVTGKTWANGSNFKKAFFIQTKK